MRILLNFSGFWKLAQIPLSFLLLIIASHTTQTLLSSWVDTAFPEDSESSRIYRAIGSRLLPGPHPELAKQTNKHWRNGQKFNQLWQIPANFSSQFLTPQQAYSLVSPWNRVKSWSSSLCSSLFLLPLWPCSVSNWKQYLKFPVV